MLERCLENALIICTNDLCSVATVRKEYEPTPALLFDPFFSTRDVGKGTGLGLSIASEIVKKHDGELLVESVVGGGGRPSR